MDDLRLAVVGVGRMGITHAENLARRVRGARLVAVTTSSAERAGDVRRCCGDVAVYPGLDALLAAEQLDAICISSSTSAHADNVEQCAAAGLHIFCEKPLALTLADCDRAIAAVQQAGVKLMMGHVRQFDAGHVEAKRYNRGGRHWSATGLPGHQRRRGPTAAQFRRSCRERRPDPGCHVPRSLPVPLAAGRRGDPGLRRGGRSGRRRRCGSVGDVDNAVVTLRFAGGPMGTLFVSRTTRYGHDLRVEVIGDEGAVQIGRFRQTPVRLLDRRGVHHDMPRTTPDRLGEAFVTELQAFVDCLTHEQGATGQRAATAGRSLR